MLPLDASSSSSGVAGNPGGTNGQIQYNNASSFGGLDSNGSGNIVRATGAAIGTPTITTPIFAGITTTTGAAVATPATITLTASAGTIDVTKIVGAVTSGGTATLTCSTDSSAAGTYVRLLLTNSNTGAASAFSLLTAGTASIGSVTVPANSTLPVQLRATGSTWLLDSGAVNVLDLSADTTPATTKLVETISATTGVSSKSTIAQITANLGTPTTLVLTNATGLLNAALPVLTINTQAGTSYTLVTADGQNSVLRLSAAACTVTFPNDTLATIGVGASGVILSTGSACIITLAAGTNAALNSRGNALKLQGQYSQAFWFKAIANTYNLTGDIVA
jgi:hypothetical protein